MQSTNVPEQGMVIIALHPMLSCEQKTPKISSLAYICKLIVAGEIYLVILGKITQMHTLSMKNVIYGIILQCLSFYKIPRSKD